MLSDTPLSYLALILPVNMVMFVAWLSSLWFMFIIVHKWIRSWVVRHRFMTCFVVDSAILGLMSFYTLWHGWQTYVIQVAGAAVFVASITHRTVVEQPNRVRLNHLFIQLSIGLMMLLVPHVGYGMTYVPAFLGLSLVVMLSRRASLFRQVARRLHVLLAPALAALVLLPYALDLAREQKIQSFLPGYLPEYGVLDYLLKIGNFFSLGSPYFGRENPISALTLVIPLAHTFLFPLLALLSPDSYQFRESPKLLTLSLNAAPWPFYIVQFHGGVLAIVLAVSSWRRSRGLPSGILIRFTTILMLLAMMAALLNTSFSSLLDLEKIPVGVLSNSRWTYADLSLILTLVLLVLQGDRFWDAIYTNTSLKSLKFLVLVALRGSRVPNFRSENLPERGLVSIFSQCLSIIGLVTVLCVLPYRVIEPLRVNDGQTRFASLQVDATTRFDNERWRQVVQSVEEDLFDREVNRPSRVLMEGERLFGGEGSSSWWGLRSHSQLRDVGLSSLLSWPRLRSGEVLSPGTKFQHVVSDPECDASLGTRLDVLSTPWAVLATDCVVRYLPDSPRVRVPLPPFWSSVKVQRDLASIMPELKARTPTFPDADYSAVRLAQFHQWLVSSPDGQSHPCGLLRQYPNDHQPCVRQLKLQRGAASSTPPLSICLQDCVATYDIRQLPPSDVYLVVPLNYDPALHVHQYGRTLRTANHRGFLAVESSGLKVGRIVVDVQPDLIMKLRAWSPIWILIVVAMWAVSSLNVPGWRVRDTPSGSFSHRKVP
jgi:hypothetical protein